VWRGEREKRRVAQRAQLMLTTELFRGNGSDAVRPPCYRGFPAWTKLDAEGHTNPMTHQGRNGNQDVVVVSSGLNAFALE
jgi:hypothetical protein